MQGITGYQRIPKLTRRSTQDMDQCLSLKFTKSNQVLRNLLPTILQVLTSVYMDLLISKPP